MVCSKTILGFIVSKEGKTHDPMKMEALVKMSMPKTLQEIQVFNGMAQFYKCFIKNFTFVMSLITKLFKKAEMFEWTIECQFAWEDIKNWYIQAPILISPYWELEFHVHIDASHLVIRPILAQNPTCKITQHVLYSSLVFNFVEINNIITEREVLAMVYALHKFRHFLLGNMFTFFTDHMVLVYLINKPHVIGG